MKRFCVVIILLAGLIFSLRPARAQGPSIEAGFYNQDVQMFFMNDLDLNNPGNNPLLFWVRIRNDAKERRVTISLKIVSKNYGLLAEGVSTPFVLKPDTLIELDNRKLAQGQGPFELKDYTLNEENVAKLRDAILSTGLLPSDHYSFVLKIQDVKEPSAEHETDIALDITNPTVVDLMSPGVPVGSSQPLPTVYTHQPQFVWNSNASTFVLTVCEKMASNSSPEEVMENVPRYQGTVRGHSFLYPASGAYPLEEGKTYYWQLEARVETSRGPRTLKSEIWGFKIARSESPGQQFAEEQIQMFLQSRQLRSLFNASTLQGCKPTGVVFINGRPVSMEDVQMILQKIESGQYKVLSVEVE